ncbi:MAG: putative Response regulator, CheY-like [Nitrospira sp.]|jgi:two-component system chemotaxis response regulator CheY|nr:putative Response regulator, CheY-like [Nitrospira sp.]
MNGYGKRVLVADDEGGVRRLIVTLLHQAGYNVHQAADGMEALVEMKKWRFDAVVAEYSLPRLDGVRLLLLSRMMWPEVPVVLLSADLTDLPLTLQKQGASALVPKPFAPQELLQALAEAVASGYAAHAGDMSPQRLPEPTEPAVALQGPVAGAD